MRPKAVEWRGTAFRSTLEATYAAMFTSLNIDWKYEPTLQQDNDWGIVGWAPDFILASRDETPTMALVEVKPVYTFGRVAQIAWDKAQRAYRASYEDREQVFLWFAPKTIRKDLMGWTAVLVRPKGLFPYPYWGDLLDAARFRMRVGGDQWRHLALLDLFVDPTLWPEDGAYPEGYPRLWYQAQGIVGTEATPSVRPWHPKDEAPSVVSCDGGRHCDCDPDAHKCPECGGFRKAHFPLCYRCEHGY